MGYEYTMGDNIEKPLRYNYAEYRGAALMRDWYAAREEAITRIGGAVQELHLQDEDLSNFVDWEHKQERAGEIDTAEMLSILLYALLKGKNISNQMKERLDGFVKTFEVRKRLYPAYSLRFKPVDEAAYKDIALYTDFACICAAAFEHYQDLRYLNVLLKVNDTLLSQLNLSPSPLEYSNQEKMGYALKKEMDYITEICQEKGIEWGAEAWY